MRLPRLRTAAIAACSVVFIPLAGATVYGADRAEAAKAPAASAAAQARPSVSQASLAPQAAKPAKARPKKAPSAGEIGAAIDATLAHELAASVSPRDKAPLTDDEAFLRRVSQDLIGEMPTAEQITAFVLDPSPKKRAEVVDRLLADPRFGTNWGRYFRDVILYRKTDPRAQITTAALLSYLADKFNSGAGWDQIAREFITAKGDVREEGSAGLIMAQMGQAPEIAAETARIFLGIQIQCAQCHDHPTDSWKRRQFHELAAFYPRLAVRPLREGEKRSFEIVSQEFQRKGPNKQPQKGKKGQRVGPEPKEYYMPDLDDPSAKGTLIQPVFFVSNQTLPAGKNDAERRAALAAYITDAKNPWFARALVNRMWAELVGRGFYEPIDDMGPERTATAPETLDLICEQFIAHGYDLKWLLRAITATEAYQRESRSRTDADDRLYCSNCPQPLRSDQVYDAVASALSLDREEPAAGEKGAGRLQRGPRGEFDRTFGYDPSNPRDEVGASIPQALLMMNAPALNRAISSGNGKTMLAKLLVAQPDDEALVTELYLRCLAREPKPEEMKRCLAYVRENGRRAEAFEDLLWVLLNSTEFTHRK